MVPPLPQPTSDRVDFASEALSALVGSEPVWKAVREFNELVTNYLVSVGSARQLDSFISDAEPKSTDVAAAAHRKAREDGQATISAGEAAIVTMREELHRTKSTAVGEYRMLPALAAAAGVTGFLVSAWVAYRNQVRRARMSVRLLSPPDGWTVATARRGAAHQDANEAEGNVVYMTGEFPGIVTNDGPRGGAIWGLRQEVDGTAGTWSVIHSKVLAQPYPLSGNACEGMSFPLHVVLFVQSRCERVWRHSNKMAGSSSS